MENMESGLEKKSRVHPISIMFGAAVLAVVVLSVALVKQKDPVTSQANLASTASEGAYPQTDEFEPITIPQDVLRADEIRKDNPNGVIIEDGEVVDENGEILSGNVLAAAVGSSGTAGTPTFEVGFKDPKHTLYANGPAAITAGITTASGEVFKATTNADGSPLCTVCRVGYYQNWKQGGEFYAKQELSLVNGPGMVRLMGASGNITNEDYVLHFPKPGQYTLRFTVTLIRTPLDTSKLISGGGTTGLRPYYANFPPTTEVVFADRTFTVSDASVTTDPTIASNKDITVWAGIDTTLTSTKKLLGFINPDTRYCFNLDADNKLITAGNKPPYKCTYTQAVEQAKKLTGKQYTTYALYGNNNYAGPTACVYVFQEVDKYSKERVKPIVSKYYRDAMCGTAIKRQHGTYAAGQLWTKVSGPGTVTFSSGSYGCSMGLMSPDKSCKEMGGKYVATSADAASGPNTARFSTPGTYVLGITYYDSDFGYQYDEKTVIVK